MDGLYPSSSVVAHCIRPSVVDNVLLELITVTFKIDAGEGVLGNMHTLEFGSQARWLNIRDDAFGPGQHFRGHPGSTRARHGLKMANARKV